MALKVRRPRLTRSDAIGEALGALGCPGFAQLPLDFGIDERQPAPDPAVVLVAALVCEKLSPNVRDALPWIVVEFPSIDWKWTVAEARRRNVQNRLGFVVTLAQHRAARGFGHDELLERLASVEELLFEVRVEREDTLCQEDLPEAERQWLRANRPREAAQWNILTDLAP